MNIGDTVMQPLLFKYPRAIKVLAYLGLPLLVGLGFLMAVAGIYVLYDPSVSFAKRAPGLISVAISIVAFWMAFMALRSWPSIFSSYSVDANGVEIQRKSFKTFLPWHRLMNARYRITLGQIELRFEGFPGIVMLSNVNMDVDRKQVDAALHLLAKVSTSGVRRTLL